MSDLRQRRSMNAIEKESLLNKRMDTASHSRYDRSRVAVVFVSLACAMLLFSNRQQHQTSLPQSYALCSRTGQSIYTVDLVGSKVQCIAVNGSQIVGTGSLGEYCHLMSIATH